MQTIIFSLVFYIISLQSYTNICLKEQYPTEYVTFARVESYNKEQV